MGMYKHTIIFSPKKRVLPKANYGHTHGYVKKTIEIHRARSFAIAKKNPKIVGNPHSLFFTKNGHVRSYL